MKAGTLKAGLTNCTDAAGCGSSGVTIRPTICSLTGPGMSAEAMADLMVSADLPHRNLQG